LKKSLFVITVLGITLLLSTRIYAQEIFNAIRSGDLSKVKELVEKDTQLVKARNANQSTPLHVAVDADNEPIARYLIEKGAELNAVNRYNWTPLLYAKGKETVNLLIEKGADINQGIGHLNALRQFMWSQKKELAEYLLEKGATLPEIGTRESDYLLFDSFKSGSIKILEKYLLLGFSPLFENETKSNLLHLASESNSAELIERLINLGVPIDAANIFGYSPLHIAALKGNAQVVRLFIEKGVDINMRTRDGKTPFNLAVEAKKEETVEYLKSAGADQSPQKFPVITGEYLGQPRPGPGQKAVPFAPGIVSGQYNFESSMTITSDGNELFWNVKDNGHSIMRMRKEDGRWKTPEIFLEGEMPFLSPNGKDFYFIANKKMTGTEIKVICIIRKKASGWSEPNELPDIVHSLPIDWQVSVDRIGNLYFSARNAWGIEHWRIHCSEFRDGRYGEPRVIETLKDVYAFCPYIAPDGSYLIISKVPGGVLSILFKKKDGTWTKGIDLADFIGTKDAFCPIVSPDGRYLFFIKGIIGYRSPYWVDASFIKDLRKKALKDDK